MLGGLHEDVVGSLESLARLNGMREDWGGARRALEEVLAIRQRQPDRKDWRVADARRALEDLGRRAAMPADRRLRLRRADELGGWWWTNTDEACTKLRRRPPSRDSDSDERSKARATPTTPRA